MLVDHDAGAEKVDREPKPNHRYLAVSTCNASNLTALSCRHRTKRLQAGQLQGGCQPGFRPEITHDEVGAQMPFPSRSSVSK